MLSREQKFFVLVLLVINVVFIYNSAYLLYDYHCLEMIHVIIIPDWILCMKIFIGIVGVFISSGILLRKVAFKKGVIWNVAVLFIGQGLELWIITWDV